MALIRRIAGLALLVAAVAAIAVFGTGADNEDKEAKNFTVELDNAFGIVDGADVKIGGVRAGKVKKLRLDKTDMRALVDFEITQTGFDELRTDVRCETRPQSLIGEYFIDCRPGVAPQRLKEGATIPVEQTETTVPLDLINNIMRRPYRERFSILLSELGGGLAARGDDLNETIRRAVPALRQVDKLLAILAEQRRTIRNLYENADRVMLQVANKRTDVTRFVEEARDTAAAASMEDDGIRAQWRTFPQFLNELTPTLRRLEETADAQIPALRSLNRAAPFIEEFANTLGPYAEASGPSIQTLGDAAQKGRPAIKAARAPIAELRKGVDDLPEAATNLAMTLEHLDDPKFAVEKDARAGRPNGGYTGLEAVLRYFFSQSQAINLFDANSFILKVSLFLDRECANYQDAQTIKTNPERCRAWLGDNQPGINSPDFTKTGSATQRSARDGDDDEAGRKGDGGKAGERDGGKDGGDRGADGGSGGGDSSGGGDGGGGGIVPKLDDLLDGALPGGTPDLPKVPDAPKVPETPKAPDAPAIGRESEDLLDFLMGN
jgi:virulence factor Mce-like protein